MNIKDYEWTKRSLYIWIGIIVVTAFITIILDALMDNFPEEIHWIYGIVWFIALGLFIWSYVRFLRKKEKPEEKKKQKMFTEEAKELAYDIARNYYHCEFIFESANTVTSGNVGTGTPILDIRGRDKWDKTPFYLFVNSFEPKNITTHYGKLKESEIKEIIKDLATDPEKRKETTRQVRSETTGEIVAETTTSEPIEQQEEKKEEKEGGFTK